MYRIGHACDTHRLAKNRKLILGGVVIPNDLGLLGHSDADCLLHAISEAIIGALGLGDLGKHFPDTDPKYKDMPSKYFLLEVKKMLEDCNYQICNIDATVYLEAPHLQPFIESISKNIASLLDISINDVNIKATRGEGLGFIGRCEGITSEAVVLIKKSIDQEK